MNLLGNAIKFTATGSVRVQVALEANSANVHITVHDTGIGIAPDRLDKIFDPFAQADATMSRRFGGTGLGTTISRQLVELMGGQLWVNSTLGVGSAFHVMLPLKLGQSVAQSHDILLYELPVLRILAADDVPQNLELLTLTLNLAGHEVVTAKDGLEAVQAFQKGKFDVVLMDVQMPLLDGLEATRQIRQLEQTNHRPHTPIVALTASAMAEDRHIAHAAGMDGFATKPIELQALIAEIARVTGVQLPPAEEVTSRAICEDLATVKTPASAIDWPHGSAMWGNPLTLGRAVRHFLQDNQDVPQQLFTELASANFEAARQLTHRVSGAAGNLCLPALLSSAKALGML